jgi:hypothetical protein
MGMDEGHAMLGQAFLTTVPEPCATTGMTKMTILIFGRVMLIIVDKHKLTDEAGQSPLCQLYCQSACGQGKGEGCGTLLNAQRGCSNKQDKG